MKFKVKLFVREHRNGFFTLRVIGSPPLSVYTASLEEARQDLILVIGDRIERTHPSVQSELISLGADRCEELEVEELMPLYVEGGGLHRPMKFSVLVSESRAFQSLWFPRVELFHWLPRKDPAWAKSAREVLKKHFARLETDVRLGMRFERKEWIEELEIDAEPPPLSAFTGKHRGLLELPAKRDTEVEEEDEEGEGDKKKKKKRPDTPTFRKIGVNFGALADDRELERAHERTRELADLMRLVEGAGEKAIAVVGKPGSGKTTILSELVYKLRAPSAPEKIRERPVWFADASRLIAGEGWFGDWQLQCLDAIREAEAAEVIWYIGPLLPLLDAGKSIYSDQNVALLLKPYLAAKRLTIIGESTEKDFAKLELRDAAFARAFTPYRIEEPPAPESKKILHDVARELATEESLDVSADGQLAILELCKRYVTDGSQLGAAIDLLRRAAEAAGARGDKKLGRSEVVAHFSKETGLPELMVRDDLPLDPIAVEIAFRSRLIGQNEAVRRMTDLVAVIKAGVSDLSRPLGSFLFVGPTGVGKTETAKALAAYLFGGEHRLARFDMSEYVAGDAVYRFLGDARTEGKLVEAVRKRPFSVVLLDEIEKAHPAIFDVLLQVLGEARLTDEAGRVADFKNAVVIMTSNLGVESLQRRTGFETQDELREHFVREAEKFFRPELFNRIDHIVPFGPLELPAIGEITRREVDKFLAREGLRQRNLALDVGPDVFEWLAERGVEPRYGARPLKRVLERSLAIPLARHVSKLKGEQPPALKVSVEGVALSFAATERVPGADRAREPSGEKMVELIARIDAVVYRAQRWAASSEYRDLAQEIRLLDQLAQNRMFWANRELAEQRLAGTDVAREILSDWEKLLERFAGLEDLAYEAYHAREIDQLPMLDTELGELTRTLAKLELRLFERRFTAPNRAVLYLVPARRSHDFLRSLIELYASLAQAEGWKLTIHSAVRPDAPANTEAEAEPAIRLVKKKKPENQGRERVNWRLKAALELPKDGKEPENVKQWIQHEVTRLHDETELALVFEGPHAAALLWGESGQHQLVSGNESAQVKVEFRDVAANATFGFAHPADLSGAGDRRRTIQENKRQVMDHVLGIHFPLEPRAHRIYRRFMMGGIYRAVFGERGLPYFRAWGDKD